MLSVAMHSGDWAFLLRKYVQRARAFRSCMRLLSITIVEVNQVTKNEMLVRENHGGMLITRKLCADVKKWRDHVITGEYFFCLEYVIGWLLNGSSFREANVLIICHSEIRIVETRFRRTFIVALFSREKGICCSVSSLLKRDSTKV